MNEFASTNPRQAGLSAWCPTCEATRECSPRQGVGEQGYRCATCHGTTHQPVIRLSRPAADEAAPAA